MIEREAFPSLDGDVIDRIGRQYEEPEWLSDSRRAAWERYEGMEMPSRTEERWRRTDISKLDMARVRPYVQPLRVTTETGFQSPEDDIHRWAQIREEMLGQGIVFGSFEEALRGSGDLFRSYLENGMEGPVETYTRLVGGIPMDADKFETLARAWGTDGYAVYVPRGVDVSAPLRVSVNAAENSSGVGGTGSLIEDLNASLSVRNVDTCVYPRSVIVAEPFSRVTVIEEFSAGGESGPYFASGLTEIFVGEGAEITIVSLQEWGAETWNFHTQRSHVARSGKIVTLNVNLGSRVTKANVEGALMGDGAQSRMLGVLFGDEKQHFDLYTLQGHHANDTLSDLLFKTALRGESKAIYSGLIRVDEKVYRADAYQANRNLMLSEKSKADSQPMLEILNNEVRCTHGATMGPVDPEQIFYLKSRGLPHPEAERMVVQGFFADALDEVRDDGTRAWVHDRVAAKIGTLAVDGEPRVEGHEVGVN